MRAASLALLLAACDRLGLAESVAGIRVEWQGQQDRASLPAELCRCWAALDTVTAPGEAARLTQGAEVLFAPDVTPWCGEYTAGCVDGDLIVVEERPTLHETALCHELAHEVRFRWVGEYDVLHTDAAWWSAVEGR